MRSRGSTSVLEDRGEEEKSKAGRRDSDGVEGDSSVLNDFGGGGRSTCNFSKVTGRAAGLGGGSPLLASADRNSSTVQSCFSESSTARVSSST